MTYMRDLMHNHPMTLSDAEAERLALQLESHANYRVLRRINPTTAFPPSDGRALLKGVIVDTETTGLSHDVDRIIEIGLLVFEYDPHTGQVCRVVASYGGLEDPGCAISDEISAITGITTAMVAGQTISDARVNELVEEASIVIAHNAKFDRPFLEKRFPIFEQIPWGCSLAQVDWAHEGFSARKLDVVAAQFGYFFDAHRAEADCMALLTILQQTLPKSGVNVLKVVLDQLSLEDWTIFALAAPFAKKEVLKARRYQWDSGRKAWCYSVHDRAGVDAEVAWLKAVIYEGRGAEPAIERCDALRRFSARPVVYP